MDPISPVIPPLPSPALTRPDPSRPGEIDRAAREFEGVFLATVVEEMLKTGGAPTFGGGHAEEMWRSFLARAYADQLSATGEFGLARSVAASLGSATAAYKDR